MTLTDIDTYLKGGLTAYQTGGASWQITSGVTKAQDYEAAVAMKGNGIFVSAYIAGGNDLSPASATNWDEMEVTVVAYARLRGDAATIETNALKATDDLMRLLRVGNGSAGDMTGRVFDIRFVAPVIAGNTADCHALGTVQYLPSEA